MRKVITTAAAVLTCLALTGAAQAGPGGKGGSGGGGGKGSGGSSGGFKPTGGSGGGIKVHTGGGFKPTQNGGGAKVHTGGGFKNHSPNWKGGFGSYHQKYGKSFGHGFCYPGKQHCHWTYSCYWPKYGCS